MPSSVASVGHDGRGVNLQVQCRPGPRTQLATSPCVMRQKGNERRGFRAPAVPLQYAAMSCVNASTRCNASPRGR
jgi:hypothetical protein